MNISMWAKALQTIPRMERDEWNALDIVSKFLVASRSGVLIITFISAALAGLYAFRDGKFDFVLWLLLTLGLLFAHATNNLLNDATDYVKGVDTDNYYRAQYGPQTLTHGFLSMKQLLAYAAVSGVIAVIAGSYLLYLRGTLAVIIFALGVFFVLFYTWPLKYIGLGEIAVIIVWGPLMIGGGYYVITGDWSWNVVVAGLPYALGATTIIFGKHIDKAPSDRAKKIFTLPVLLGDRLARYTAIAMMLGQYLSIAYLVVIGYFTPILAVVLFALPLFKQAINIFKDPKPQAAPDWLPQGVWPLWFSASAFVHNRRFGLLFLAGFIGDLIARAIIFK